MTQAEAIAKLPQIAGYHWLPMGKLWFVLMPDGDDTDGMQGWEIREWCGGWRVHKQWYSQRNTFDEAVQFFVSERAVL